MEVVISVTRVTVSSGGAYVCATIGWPKNTHMVPINHPFEGELYMRTKGSNMSLYSCLRHHELGLTITGPHEA